METGSNKTDLAVSLSKGVLGAIPLIGPLMAELVGTLIPNQRLDRIEKFLKILDEKVSGVDKEHLDSRVKNEEFIDILEDGMYQVSRAISDERKEYIASVIENGIKEEEFEYLQKKLILNLLNELNDAEIIVLQSYGSHPGVRNDFFEKHKEVLMPPIAAVGSPPEVIEDRALFDAQRDHLVRLGLIRPRFKKPKRGEFPEFDDKTGMIKAQGYDITQLGRVLLKNIGLKTWP